MQRSGASAQRLRAALDDRRAIVLTRANRTLLNARDGAERFTARVEAVRPAIRGTAAKQAQLRETVRSVRNKVGAVRNNVVRIDQEGLGVGAPSLPTYKPTSRRRTTTEQSMSPRPRAGGEASNRPSRFDFSSTSSDRATLDPGERDRRDAEKQQRVDAAATVAEVDPDKQERDARGVGEVLRPGHHRRHFGVHRRSSPFGARRASGSKRITNPSIRMIRPNNVPSMMTAPMVSPFRLCVSLR